MKVFIVFLALTSYAVADKLMDGQPQEHHHDEHHHAEHPTTKKAQLNSPASPTIVYAQAMEPIVPSPEYSQLPQAPAPSYSQPPQAPVPSYSQPPQAPAPSYSQPPQASAPTNSQPPQAPAPAYWKQSTLNLNKEEEPAVQYDNQNGYYYYYYPAEEVEEKNFWSKMMEKLYINKMMDTVTGWFEQTARSDLSVEGLEESLSLRGTSIFVLGAATALGSMLLYPSIGRTLTDLPLPFAFKAIWVKIVAFFDQIFGNIIASRDIEFDTDDIMLYAKTIYEAIDREY